MNGNDMLTGFVEESLVAPTGMRSLESTSNVIVITKPHYSHRQQKRILVAPWISNSFLKRHQQPSKTLWWGKHKTV